MMMQPYFEKPNDYPRFYHCERQSRSSSELMMIAFVVAVDSDEVAVVVVTVAVVTVAVVETMLLHRFYHGPRRHQCHPLSMDDCVYRDHLKFDYSWYCYCYCYCYYWYQFSYQMMMT
jgi:hypothetical protein